MTIFADLLSTIFERRYGTTKPAQLGNRPLSKLAEELIGTAGETSGLALAEEILSRFETLGDDQKLEFFRYIATAMDINPHDVRNTLDTYEREPSKNTYRAFAEAAEPRRQELIRRLNRVPGATGQLVHLRAELLRLAAQEPQLAALDLDFRHLFTSWFNRGFLVLRPISWESPAHILEKIIAYEAVHAIASWEDLRRRLKPADRRCFAFFHPSMPDEPLIFVEVALTTGIPGSVQTLLAEDRMPISAHESDTAVFYSISNCQMGLASISFGNSLIKQVASDLSSELPGIKAFVTLSPIPGLAEWAHQEGYKMPTEEPEAIRAMAAFYLLNAKGRGGLPFDPVARFHLGNGAIVNAVHAVADTSEKGIAQSGGTMVNYLYDLSRIAQNHEVFATSRAVVAKPDVKTLAESADFDPIIER